MQKNLTALMASCCAFSFLIGCTPTTSFLSLNRIPKATKKNPVSEVLAIWEAAEGKGPEGQARRGAAGQILFMTRGEKGPVKINGTVTIRTYDNLAPPGERAKPLHTFNFGPGSWNNHFVDGSLGPAYSVFIPHMRTTRLETDFAIEVEVTAENGRTVTSDLSRIHLPGISQKKMHEITTRRIVKKPKKPAARKLESTSLAFFDGEGQVHAMSQPETDEAKQVDEVQMAAHSEDATAASSAGKKPRKKMSSETRQKLVAEFRAQIEAMRKPATKSAGPATTGNPAE